jgi:glycine cleavage system protein P-like pyridoxal-binding family
MIDSQLNARTLLFARLYKQLRIEDEENELKEESFALYCEVTKNLIEAIKEIYEKDIEENRAKEKANRRKTVEKDS